MVEETVSNPKAAPEPESTGPKIFTVESILFFCEPLFLHRESYIFRKFPKSKTQHNYSLITNQFYIVLRLIRDAQQQHGLRHGDYQRYRGYCKRRIGRLRSVLKLPQGEKRHYKKRDVLITYLQGPNADVRYLHIPVILAERAWAYAMQLRQESNTERRKKFHLIGKLRKACGYALQLQELCSVNYFFFIAFPKLLNIFG